MPHKTEPVPTEYTTASLYDYMDYQSYEDSLEFYSSSPATMTGSCYEPQPLDHHPLLDTNNPPVARPSHYPYSPGAAAAVYSSIPPNSTVDPHGMMYPQTLWGAQNSPHHLMDDKRGSVIMGQAPPAPPAKRKGGRKPKDDPNLPPLEKEKRRLRRLRNKEAAAKCRERRLNHTSSLLQQIEQLEKSQTKFEEQISQLRQCKDQCEKLLKSHEQDCSKTFSDKSPASSTAASINTPSPQRTEDSTTQPSPPTAISNHSPPPTNSSTVSSVDSSERMLAPVTSAATSTSTMVNRRKQATPRGLNLDISCADSHRRSSSSSSGDLQSPKVIM